MQCTSDGTGQAHCEAACTHAVVGDMIRVPHVAQVGHALTRKVRL
jgi:hypothetical protein